MFFSSVFDHIRVFWLSFGLATLDCFSVGACAQCTGSVQFRSKDCCYYQWAAISFWRWKIWRSLCSRRRNWFQRRNWFRWNPARIIQLHWSKWTKTQHFIHRRQKWVRFHIQFNRKLFYEGIAVDCNRMLCHCNNIPERKKHLNFSPPHLHDQFFINISSRIQIFFSYRTHLF